MSDGCFPQSAFHMSTARASMTNTAAHQPLPPGHPGIAPRWTSGAKTAIGRSADENSRVWFTIARGIVSEVYYPMTDQANSRDLGFLVADGLDFFSEEQRHTIQQIAVLAPGVPRYRLINTCAQGRYRIAKTVVTDCGWDALVQQVGFEVLRGRLADYGLYALLAPHIANHGAGNSGCAGEHADGGPFDGIGIERGGPLLAGERAHYELAAGRYTEAMRLLRVMAAQASAGGMIPEQIWDGPDIPERGLFNGHPTDSAMPLVWAHAEYIKLARSLRDGRVFDLPPQPVQRYQVDKVGSRFAIWRFNQRCRRMPAGKTLRIETLAAARVHWSLDSWCTVYDTPPTAAMWVVIDQENIG
jgi:hypothetical protein